MVNRTLPWGGATSRFLAEAGKQMQGENMSARLTLLAMAMLAASNASASSVCGNALTDFEKIVNSDVATGNLNKSVHRRIAGELTRVQSECIAGRDAQAVSHLSDIKRRFGYR